MSEAIQDIKEGVVLAELGGYGDGPYCATHAANAALAMMGKIEYEVRLPLCRMADVTYGKLKQIMTDYGLIW